ncbi:MAG TPA: hypothetical protein VJ782_01600 [Aeromicrobium sp.]|nr:hypothetical protein [Aeromicrobium sp.]
MTVEAILLVATALVALVALFAAFVAVRAARELKALRDLDTGDAVALLDHRGDDGVELPSPESTAVSRPPVPELEPRVVHGRVVVPPTQAQVVRTALGRPGVRLSVFAHGLARALRAENRDRIVALMRREYRHRRRERMRAGRQAIRMTHPTSAPSTDRLHQHLLESKPLTLTDRMVGS